MVKIKHMFARFESARLQGKQQANVYIDVIIILIILHVLTSVIEITKSYYGNIIIDRT